MRNNYFPYRIFLLILFAGCAEREKEVTFVSKPGYYPDFYNSYSLYVFEYNSLLCVRLLKENESWGHADGAINPNKEWWIKKEGDSLKMKYNDRMHIWRDDGFEKSTVTK